MDNDEELDGKYLGTISGDFIKVSDTLKEASYQIRRRGFDFPIFPICKDEQPVGLLLIAKETMGNQWHYYASFLDEFVQRGLIEESFRQRFIDTYKDPDEFCCLFVIDRELTRFVYIPYPVD
ncbi:MAG TPA: hypothetical protein VKZ86_06225 [Cyclobacteriaceae bacterium]|nr:hypothetical protein [Cyclobacteriaceae bacterium]